MIVENPTESARTLPLHGIRIGHAPGFIHARPPVVAIAG
jgi:hypothetical protein